MSDTSTTSFKKSLNLFDSTAIVMGSMIGSGIFIVSADMSRVLGAPGWLIVAWAITGVLTLFAALSYGELAAMMPNAGGQYVYLRESYNSLTGFLYGWTLFLVIQTGTIAAVGMAFAKFSGVIFPGISESHTLFEMGFLKISTVHIVAISMIFFLTWSNSRGIRTGKYIQNSFTYLKALILIIFIIGGFWLASNIKAIDLNKSIFWDAVSTSKDGVIISLSGFALIAALGISQVGSLFTSDAWNNITFTAGEVVNPKKNIPLSLFIGTLAVTIIYILINFVYLQALPLRGDPHATTVFERGIQFATNDRLGTATIYSLFGESAAVLMAIFIVISTFGCNNGIILSGARVYYAMANDNLFFKQVGKLNKNGVPGKGLYVQAIWASLLCLSGSYNQLLDYVVLAVLIFYVLTIGGVFILRHRKPNVERPYKTFGYPVVPAIYILLAVFIMIILLIYKPDYTRPGLIIVLTGIPVYYIWRRFSHKTE
jgi:basic amino acid/polyamine antiporter, APA family